MKRAGLTLMDIVVAIACLAMIVGLTIPWIARSGNRHTRVRCAGNLRQIGQAILLYANENRQMWPFARYQSGAPPVAYTQPNASHPFAPDGPGPNDVTAALFLLIRTQDIPPQVYLCPMTDLHPWWLSTQTLKQMTNFPGEDALSYSFLNLYAPMELGYRRTSNQNPEHAIAADMNPGTAELIGLSPASPYARIRAGNSYNHNQRDQNILFGDGHAELVPTPLAGIRQDNIYTAGQGETEVIVGPPAHLDDAVLLPAATKPPPGTWAYQPTFYNSGPIFITAIVVLLFAAAIAWYWRIGRHWAGPWPKET